MANGQTSALTETLNKPFDPFSTVGQINKGSTVEARGKAARGAQEQFLREEVAASAAADAEKARLKKEQIGKEVQTEKDYVQGLETVGAELRGAMGGYPERKLTQFDAAAANELAANTLLMSVFGGAVSGRAALRAMEGFTNGYRQGREDLYNKELKNYEAEIEKFKDKVSRAKTIYEDALKLESAKRGAGLVKLKELEPELADTYLATQTRMKGFAGTGKAIQEMMKLADQIEVAKIKTTDKNRTALPPDLAKSYIKIQPVYKSFDRLNQSKNENYFGVVPNETAARLLMKAVEVDLTKDLTDSLKERFKISEDQILWWKEYDLFVAKVRNELFGATLTKAEEKNFDRTIITPATNPSLATKFFEEQVAIVNDAVNREVSKGLARGVDPEVISTYLGVNVGSSQRQGANQRQLSPQDQQALNWANENPDDPRSAQIKQRLGR